MAAFLNKKRPMKLFCREKGNNTNPPFIILHGLWGASDNWLQIANHLSEKYHVILPDLRNHGQSPFDERMDYDVMSDDVIELIESLKLHIKPIIAGHSMGGKVTMTLLLKKPEIASKAAIIDIAPVTYPPVQAAEHYALLRFITSTNLSAFHKREEAIRLIRQAFSDEGLQQLLFKNIRKTANGIEWRINPVAIRNHINDIIAWNIPAGKSSYPGKILFIKGANSRYIREEDYPGIKKIFPAAAFITIPSAGHLIHAEQPEILADILLNL